MKINETNASASQMHSAYETTPHNSFRHSNSIHSVHLSMHSLSNPKNAKSINLIQDMLSTSKNSFQSSSKNFSVPSNAGTFENMLEDINNTLLIQRKQHNEEILNVYHELVKSVNDIKNEIGKCNDEQEKIEQNVTEIQNESSQIQMEVERAKTENFHNQIEIVYLKKKIEEIQKEIENVNKETRDIKYMQYKLMSEKNSNQGGLKKDSFKIEALINDKKNLSTAIVIMNKKLNKLKQEMAVHVYKGELFINEFGKFVQREKNEDTTSTHNDSHK